MTGLPMTVPAERLPAKVTIYEVGPRDGLQNEAAIVPVEVKAEFVRRLVAAGLPIVEATSFVHPKWVPQLADAAELMADLGEQGRHLPVLVPNERGLDRALELGLEHIAIFGSATETFATKNLNRTFDEQFAMFEPTVARAREAGLDVRAYVSMCFGDPWEGDVPVDQVVSVGKRLFDLGASQLSLGDTIGVGTPGHVVALLDAFNAAGLSTERISGGSTPSRFMTHETCVNELRAGTYALLDREDGAADFSDCAITVEVTVISDRVPDQIVVPAGSRTAWSGRSGPSDVARPRSAPVTATWTGTSTTSVGPATVISRSGASTGAPTSRFARRAATRSAAPPTGMPNRPRPGRPRASWMVVRKPGSTTRSVPITRPRSARGHPAGGWSGPRASGRHSGRSAASSCGR